MEKASWDDSADYYCQASNGATSIKKSKTITIEVQGQCVVKKITTTAGKIGKDGKQSATLTCEIDEAVQFEAINKLNELFRNKVVNLCFILLYSQLVKFYGSSKKMFSKPVKKETSLFLIMSMKLKAVNYRMIRFFKF